MIYKVIKMADVYTVLADLAGSKEESLQVFIPEGALLLENKLNLQFLVESLQKLGKSVTFETDDAAGRELLSDLVGAGSVNLEDNSAPKKQGFRGRLAGVFPLRVLSRIKSRFSSLRFERPSFSFRLNFVLLGVLVLLLGGGAFGVHRYISSQKAYVKLVAKSEPIARSITVRVDADQTTNVTSKVLAGKNVSAVAFETLEAETTGEKVIGERAEGKITVYNRTEDEIDLDKGTKVVYKSDDSDDDDLEFELKDDLTIPPLSYEVPEDPASAMVPGEASVEVEAVEFGVDYNIDSDKALEFEDYKKSELVAESAEDFEGGSRDTVAIVSAEDIESVSAELVSLLEEQAGEALKDVIPSGYKLINGSFAMVLQDPELSAEEGEEADTLEIRQAMNVTGLVYEEKKLDELIMKIVGEYVPEEYEITDGSHSLNVEVLGSTEDAVLSSTEADLQVTVKTSVVPDIDIDSLKTRLAGKSLQEVQRVLGSMRSLSTYEFSLSPTVPFKRAFPGETERILIEIEED